jgi:periplasmic protein TonB
MAYSDNRGFTFSPASLAGTVVFNGLVATAAVLAAVTVLPKVKEPPLDVFWVPTEPIATTETKKPVEDPKPDTITAATRTNVATPPIDTKTDIAPQPGFTENDFPLGPVGSIEPTPPVPILVPNPIETSAFVDNRHKGDLQPQYPLGAQREGLEGKVSIRVLVGVDGRVKSVEPISFTDERFLKATREQAIRKWRFVPATSDGKPVESWQTMSIRFEMPE